MRPAGWAKPRRSLAPGTSCRASRCVTLGTLPRWEVLPLSRNHATSCRVQRELRLYSPTLLEKPALIVANKVDKLRRPMATIRALQRRTRLPVIPTAAVQQPLGMTRLRQQLAALAGYSSAN